MRRFEQALVVGAGGAVGALVRWAIVRGIDLDTTFPWATLTANLAGCAGLGVISGQWHTGGHVRWRWFLGAGVCGGLTTMSTFAVEVVDLARSGMLGAATYLLASVAGGLAVFSATRSVTSGRGAPT